MLIINMNSKPLYKKIIESKDVKIIRDLISVFNNNK
jgi:hypothetical protein